MTAVATLLAGIRETSDGLTDLCAEHLRQSIRHVQRNCDIDCNLHEGELKWDDCKQPDRYDGDRMARALASIPRLVAAIEAVEKVHEPVDALMNPGRHERVVKVCTGCGTDDGNWQRWPCPTVRAVTAALGGGE